MTIPKYSVDDMVIFAPVMDWRERDRWTLGFIRECFPGDFSGITVYQLADLDGKEHTRTEDRIKSVIVDLTELVAI